MDIFQLDNHVYLKVKPQSVNLIHTFQASKKHQDHILHTTPNRKELSGHRNKT